MSYLPRLLVLAGVWALVVMSPGPDFVVTVTRAAGSRRAGLAAAAGIVAGTAIWASVSAAGAGMVLARYRWAAETVRLAGAAYLAWLGLRMILDSRRALPDALSDAGPDAGRDADRRSGAAWRAGLLADLGNPKAAVFWTGLFAAVLPAAAPVPVRASAVLVAVAVAAAWYAAVACAFSLAAISRRYRQAKKWIDRVTGGVLAGLAVRLATER